MTVIRWRVSVVLLATVLNAGVLFVAFRYYNSVHVLAVDPLGVPPGTTQFRPLHRIEVASAIMQLLIILAGVRIWCAVQAAMRP